MEHYICTECKRQWGEPLCHLYIGKDCSNAPMTCHSDGHKVTWEPAGKGRPKKPEDNE